MKDMREIEMVIFEVLRESQKGRRNFTSNWGLSRRKDYDTKKTVKVPPISGI